MKKYSEDKFVLKCPLTPFEIFERLNGRTLEKKTLAMVWTDKDFIGKISKASFEVIDSSYPIPYGAACILKGTINPNSTINLVTSLHRGFRILFLVWILVMTGAFLAFWIIDSPPLDGLLATIILLPLGAISFRLFLHGMYVLARNRGVTKMKSILEATD